MCASFSSMGSGLMHTVSFFPLESLGCLAAAAEGVLAHLAGSAFSCQPAYCFAWLNFAFPLLSAFLSTVDIGLVHYAAFLLASGGGSLALFSLVCFILEDGHWADALCCHFQFKSRVSCSIGLLSLAGLACPSRMDIGLMHSVAFSMFKSRLSGSLLSYLLSSHGCRLGSCILLHFAWTLHDSACCRALHWATPQEP